MALPRNGRRRPKDQVDETLCGSFKGEEDSIVFTDYEKSSFSSCSKAGARTRRSSRPTRQGSKAPGSYAGDYQKTKLPPVPSASTRRDIQEPLPDEKDSDNETASDSDEDSRLFEAFRQISVESSGSSETKMAPCSGSSATTMAASSGTTHDSPHLMVAKIWDPMVEESPVVSPRDSPPSVRGTTSYSLPIRMSTRPIASESLRKSLWRRAVASAPFGGGPSEPAELLTSVADSPLGAILRPAGQPRPGGRPSSAVFRSSEPLPVDQVPSSPTADPDLQLPPLGNPAEPREEADPNSFEVFAPPRRGVRSSAINHNGRILLEKTRTGCFTLE